MAVLPSEHFCAHTIVAGLAGRGAAALKARGAERICKPFKLCACSAMAMALTREVSRGAQVGVRQPDDAVKIAIQYVAHAQLRSLKRWALSWPGPGKARRRVLEAGSTGGQGTPRFTFPSFLTAERVL